MSSNLFRSNFTRQFDHVGVIAHGAHPEYRLEFDAEIGDTAANAANLFQGSIVSLNANGKFILGVGAASATNKPVPMVSMKNAWDPDVTTGVGTITVSGQTGTAPSWNGGTVYTSPLKNTYSAVGGKITAIPCTGSYEFETTEFVAGSYSPNDVLLPATGTNSGKVTKATAEVVGGTAGAVVGFVSKAPYTVAAYGHSRLSFFANFIPGLSGK